MSTSLVDAAAIGERAGVRARTVHQWRQRFPDFPAPRHRFAMGPVWEWPAVEAWLRQTGRI